MSAQQSVNFFNKYAGHSKGLLRMYFGEDNQKEASRTAKLIRASGYGVVPLELSGYHEPELRLLFGESISGIRDIRKVLRAADPKNRLFKDGWTHESASKLIMALHRKMMEKDS